MAAKSSRLRKTQRDALFKNAMLAESTRGSVSDYGGRVVGSNPTPTVDPSSYNKKRLHSARDSIEMDRQHGQDHTEDIDYEDDGRSASKVHGHTPKRSRPGDPANWPLRNDAPNKDDSRMKNSSLRKKVSAISLASGRRRESFRQHLPGRPSRFLEGSMNDRASKNPPAAFTEDYDAVGRYLADQEAVSTLGDPNSAYQLGVMDTVTSENTAEATGSQRSGIWRFGKAVADWFNFNKFVREEAERDRQKRILQRRQEKALKLYDELKKTGQLYSVKTSVSQAAGSFTTPDHRQSHENGTSASCHESRTDASEQRYPEFLRKVGPTSDAAYGLMPPPSLPTHGISGTPASTSSRQSSAFHFKKPSFPNLKKVRSEVQLSSSSFVAPFTKGSSTRNGDNDVATNMLRKQPSKKDLQKQQKLSKKVSDLETKLQAARRELQAALGEIPPVPALPPPSARKTFVPGTLPSLPSERLILQDLNFSPEGDVGNDGATGIENVDSTVLAEPPGALRRAARRDIASRKAKARAVRKTTLPAMTSDPNTASKKRKSGGHVGDDENYNSNVGGEDGLAREKLEIKTMRKSGRPRKSQKVGRMSSPGSVAKEQFAVMEDNDNELAAEECEPDDLSTTPREKHEDPFTAGQSDQVATLARSIASREFKASRIPRRSTSPPPGVGSSNTQTINGQVVEGSISVIPDNVSVPPVPKLPPGIERMVVLSSRDGSKENVNVDPEKKPQPERLLEPYQWPDDVF